MEGGVRPGGVGGRASAIDRVRATRARGSARSVGGGRTASACGEDSVGAFGAIRGAPGATHHARAGPQSLVAASGHEPIPHAEGWFVAAHAGPSAIRQSNGTSRHASAHHWSVGSAEPTDTTTLAARIHRWNRRVSEPRTRLESFIIAIERGTVIRRSCSDHVMNGARNSREKGEA